MSQQQISALLEVNQQTGLSRKIIQVIDDAIGGSPWYLVHWREFKDPETGKHGRTALQEFIHRHVRWIPDYTEFIEDLVQEFNATQQAGVWLDVALFLSTVDARRVAEIEDVLRLMRECVVREPSDISLETLLQLYRQAWFLVHGDSALSENAFREILVQR